MSQLLWIWDDSIRTLPFDTAQADRALDAAGWRRAGYARPPDGAASRALAFDILVPGTSPTRRQLAVALQAMWQAVGAAVTVTAVDFPVFQERLGKGQFDSYIGAWLDEPSPRGLADQWTRAGWGALNYGHYANPAFDALFERATPGANGGFGARGSTARRWTRSTRTRRRSSSTRRPTSAVVSRRVEGVEIDPYSWASGLRVWSAGR